MEVGVGGVCVNNLQRESLVTKGQALYYHLRGGGGGGGVRGVREGWGRGQRTGGMCEQSAVGKSGLSSTKYWSPRGRPCQGNKT